MLRIHDTAMHLGTEITVIRFVIMKPDSLDDRNDVDEADKLITEILIEEREEERKLRARINLPCSERTEMLWALPEDATHVYARTIDGELVTVPLAECRLVRRAQRKSGLVDMHAKYCAQVRRSRQMSPRIEWVWT